MWKLLRSQYEKSLAERRDVKDFPLTRFVSMIVALIALYVVVSLVVLPSDAKPEFNFVDERGSVTALSAILLASGAAFSFAAFVLSVGDLFRTRMFWLIAAAALGLLSLDELLQFHERIGDRIDAWGVNAGPVRHWNDIIVISYGVLALGFLAFFLPVILRSPRFLKLLIVAFLFFVLHTAIDSVTEPPTTASMIVEETAKLYSATFISIAFLVGMLNSPLSRNG